MSNKKDLPIYKLIIEDGDDTEVNMISLVENPAIEISYIAFNKAKKIKDNFKVQDVSKKCLIGPLMVPNTPIYRIDQNTGEEYFVVMDEETINIAVKKFAKNRFTTNINSQHSIPLNGGTLIESWIIIDPDNDKSKAFGFKDLKKGTWMGIVNLEENDWNRFIINGDLKYGGFSVEGNFLKSSEPIQQSFNNINNLKELTNIVYDFLLEMEIKK